MADTFEVVSSRLLNSLVGGDGGIPSSSSQVLTVLVRDVDALAIFVAFGESKINNINIVPCLISATNQEVVRLNVSVDKPLFVYFFDALIELDGNMEHGFEVKLVFAGDKKVFEGGSQEVHDHNVEVFVRDRRIVRSYIV